MKALRWIGAAATIAAAATGSIVFTSTSSMAADTPPPLEEDFAYPNREAIEARYKIKLFKGDGHILFVKPESEDTTEQCKVGEIQVEKHMSEAPYHAYYCFVTKGKKGWLTLEVPGTFGVRGGGTALVATANLPDGKKTYQVPANTFVPISPGGPDETPRASLVELRFG